MRIKRLAGPAIVIAVLGVLGAGIYYKIAGKQDASATADAAAAAADRGPAPATSVLNTFNSNIPIPVEAAPVLKETLVLKVGANGTVVSPRQVTLTPQVSAPIRSILVRENDHVQEGQVLIEQDTMDLHLDILTAELNLGSAQKRFDRLMLGSAADPADVRAAREANSRVESGLETAKIQLERARRAIAKAKVLAPFAGRIANIMVVPGQHVSGGELLTITQLDPIEIEVGVMEADIGLLERGRGAEITFNSISGEVFRGRVTGINPILDENRQARVTVQVPNPRGRILPGMSARASLDARMLPNRTLVPRSSIVERDGRKLVFLFEPAEGPAEIGASGRAMWQYVATGLQNDTHIELIEDPNDSQVRVPAAGEIVLTAGHVSLPHGATVGLVENALAAGGRPK